MMVDGTAGGLLQKSNRIYYIPVSVRSELMPRRRRRKKREEEWIKAINLKPVSKNERCSSGALKLLQ